MKKPPAPELARYRTTQTQSGIFVVQYHTEIMEARMGMTALVSLMLMASQLYYKLVLSTNYILRRKLNWDPGLCQIPTWNS
jgi:hypothetical protein